MSRAHYDDGAVRLYAGNVGDPETFAEIADGSVRTIVTSPPYFGLRDYGVEGQLGAEATLEDYVDNLVAVFAGLRRVLADDGTLWLNLGDSYSGRADASAAASFRRDRADVLNGRKNTASSLGTKQLLGVPWRVAFALQADGWVLRSEVIWAKPNPMPESVSDRPTRSHEYIFMLTKQGRYYYDGDAIAETATGRGSGNGFARPESINRGGVGPDEPWEGRPQLRRALELAKAAGLTEEHFAAIRAIGMNDAGKAREVQSGMGKNTATAQRLADEAKAVLGGYYREFLTGGTRNKRDVWTVPTVPFGEAHFAVYPPELIRPCIQASSQVGDTILDPFSGSGTTGMVARQEGRRYVGIDLNRDYLDLSLRTRFAQPVMNIWSEA